MLSRFTKACPILHLLLMVTQVATAQEITFQKQVLSGRYYCDGITSGDINADGNVDVVAGPFWYEGPTFTKAHEIYEPVSLVLEESPSNSMFSFVHDFNNDGRLDVLVLGRVHKHEAKWYENPGNNDVLWNSHFVFERIRGESPTLVDMNGDGVPQLICHWEGCWGYVQPDQKSPTSSWKFTPIGANEDWPQFYHGEGVGDVNDDGRLDLMTNDGWYEQPKQPAPLWKFHRLKFSEQRGGAQMFAYDVDADGDSDVISAVDAHGWGLAWYEQNSTDGNAPFTEHLLMHDHSQKKEFGVAFTQPHALVLADINGDGLQDIVTGKRMWAHGPTGDIEPNAAPVVYWFELTRTQNGVKYVPHLVDDNSGVGVQIHAADVNKDGRVDIMTASKLGSFLFLNTAD